MDWYSKKQATVETTTFGSEFITARTTIDQIVYLQMTLHYLGIPIQELFEKRAMSLETTRPLLMPCQPHMPNYTRDTMLYHSIIYKRQLLPNMLRSSICRVSTTLPTSSASTGLMLQYGKP
jgi:hypothetical protein